MSAKDDHLHVQLPKIRVGWPEKAAIGTALAVIVVVALVWAVLADGVGSFGDRRLNLALFHLFVDAEFVLVAPLWLTLRTICFIINGSLHRRAPR